jgi:hypothetical protein
MEKTSWDFHNVKRDSGVFVPVEDELSFIKILPCGNRKESGACIASSPAPVPRHMTLEQLLPDAIVNWHRLPNRIGGNQRTSQ